MPDVADGREAPCSAPVFDVEFARGQFPALEAEDIRIREWRFDPERLELTLAGLEPLLTHRTRLVCFTHCSNIVGTVHDAAAIVRRVHEAGANGSRPATGTSTPAGRSRRSASCPVTESCR